MSFRAIANPEDMSPNEWNFFERCNILFSGLIEDLKDGGLLKTLEELPENQPKITETYAKINEGYNMFLDIFEESAQLLKFIKHNAVFGFTEEKLPYLLASVVIGEFIIINEMFRNLMLTILKLEDPFSEKMTLNQLLIELEKVSTYYGKEIKKLFLTKLRNALVHLTFWIDGNKLYFCDDMKLENPSNILISKLIMEVKKTAIMNTSLFVLIVERYSDEDKIF